MNVRVYTDKPSKEAGPGAVPNGSTLGFITDESPAVKTTDGDGNDFGRGGASDILYGEAKQLNLVTTCNGASNSQLLTLIPGITLAVDSEGNNLRFLATGQQFLSTEI